MFERRRGPTLFAVAVGAAAALFSFAAGPEPGPIDTAAAAHAFAERRAACTRDGGRLWGVSLCGPLAFVDRATRTTVSDVPSADLHAVARDGVYVGTLPAAIGVANTAAMLGATRWSLVVWPLPNDPLLRAILVVHESWHRVQDGLGLPLSSPANDHLDTAGGRYWLQLEWRALARAAVAAGAARRTAVGDVLAFRAARVAGVPGAAATENALMLNEGLAEDTGVVLTTPDARDRAARVVEELALGRARVSFVRSFAYASGPAYALLLDAATPGWRRRLRSSSDLATMLAHAYGARPAAALAQRRSSAYDDGALRIAEDERAAANAQRLRELRARFIDGPVLRIHVRDARFTFDPNDVVPVPGAGSVYGTFGAIGWFGSLDAPGGALIDTSFSTFTVRAPAPGAATSSEWTLSLAPGCALTPDGRANDLTVTCASPAPR